MAQADTEVQQMTLAQALRTMADHYRNSGVYALGSCQLPLLLANHPGNDDTPARVKPQLVQLKSHIDGWMSRLDERVSGSHNEVSNLSGQVSHIDTQVSCFDERFEELRELAALGVKRSGDLIELVHHSTNRATTDLGGVETRLTKLEALVASTHADFMSSISDVERRVADTELGLTTV
ncbi:hypothetical protein FRC11_003645 [Ceratobasidium sp. 423]|nr:hypothetical protein FRC11_003645 [Ceratobasidium sp. 423]